MSFKDEISKTKQEISSSSGNKRNKNTGSGNLFGNGKETRYSGRPITEGTDLINGDDNE
ncbi:hypothetical protein OQL12_001170 [Clostridium perfringens]|uniref:hypothetical protein n=1 Tax=Clostridium perfringens TaxID=1502 RepID=UPI0024687EE8|nr:hypothetical protein [Clostridium perfringens]MDH5074794.1 hypothetical protein [Clostridium perfringens]